MYMFIAAVGAAAAVGAQHPGAVGADALAPVDVEFERLAGSSRPTVAVFGRWDRTDGWHSRLGAYWMTHLKGRLAARQDMVGGIVAFEDPAHSDGLTSAQIAARAAQYGAVLSAVVQVVPVDSYGNHVLDVVFLDGRGLTLQRVVTGPVGSPVGPPPVAAMSRPAGPPAASSPSAARADPSRAREFAQLALRYRGQSVTSSQGVVLGDRWLAENLPPGRLALKLEEATSRSTTLGILTNLCLVGWLGGCCAASGGAFFGTLCSCMGAPFLGKVPVSQVPYELGVTGVVGSLLGMCSGGCVGVASLTGGGLTVLLARMMAEQLWITSVTDEDRAVAVSQYNRRLAATLGLHPRDLDPAFFPAGQYPTEDQ